MARKLTFEQAQGRKAKAARFLRDVLGDRDRADEVEAESVADYASRRHFVITNPTVKEVKHMAEPREKLEDVLSDRDALIDKLEGIRVDIDDALAEYDGDDDDDSDEDDSHNGDDQ